MKFISEVSVILLLAVLPIATAVYLSKVTPRYKKGIECHVNKNCVQLGYFDFGSK